LLFGILLNLWIYVKQKLVNLYNLDVSLLIDYLLVYIPATISNSILSFILDNTSFLSYMMSSGNGDNTSNIGEINAGNVSGDNSNNTGNSNDTGNNSDNDGNNSEGNNNSDDPGTPDLEDDSNDVFQDVRVLMKSVKNYRMTLTLLLGQD